MCVQNDADNRLGEEVPDWTNGVRPWLTKHIVDNTLLNPVINGLKVPENNVAGHMKC